MGRRYQVLVFKNASTLLLSQSVERGDFKMWNLILTLLLLSLTVSTQGCDNSECNKGIYRYYKELNCQPILEEGSCCPARFDCSHMSNREPNKCHVRDSSFDIGAAVGKEHLHNPCVADCYCAGNEDNTRADLRCANIECPESMGVPAPPGCVYEYTPGACCATGTICGNETIPEKFKCQHGDHSHDLGEKFYPDDSCMRCICQQGFDGTLREPWCSELECGLEVHYGDDIRDGCVPVYIGANKCCPIEWRCPKDTDTVEASGADIATDAHECVFGKLHLKVNEKLNAESTCMECTCAVPPHVSCVKTSNSC